MVLWVLLLPLNQWAFALEKGVCALDGVLFIGAHRRLGEGGAEHVLDVTQRRVDDLVAVGQAVDTPVAQVHVDVVRLLQRVRVGLRVLPAPLEILAANQARVDVEVVASHGARLLKVKVEDHPVDRVEVRAAEAGVVPWPTLHAAADWGGGDGGRRARRRRRAFATL